MARTPIDAGVKIVLATVTPAHDAAHYHYEVVGAKRVGWNEVPFVAALDVVAGDTAEAQENAIIAEVNNVAGDL